MTAARGSSPITTPQHGSGDSIAQDSKWKREAMEH